MTVGSYETTVGQRSDILGWARSPNVQMYQAKQNASIKRNNKLGLPFKKRRFNCSSSLQGNPCVIFTFCTTMQCKTVFEILIGPPCTTIHWQLHVVTECSHLQYSSDPWRLFDHSGLLELCFVETQVLLNMLRLYTFCNSVIKLHCTTETRTAPHKLN